MQKKAALLCATAALCLAVLAACGEPAIIGTWYQTDLNTGEQMTMQFDPDGTGIEGTTAFTWKEDNGIYTLTSGTMAVQVSIADDSITYTASNGEPATYYRDQARAQQMYEDARQARVNVASAEKERIIGQLGGELAGTYGYSIENNWYGFTDTWEVTYKADGTWTKHSVEHLDVDFSTRSSREAVTDSSGTWEIVYEDEVSDFPDEHCSNENFEIKILKEDGSEFTLDERSKINENEYPSAAQIKIVGSEATIQARSPYEKRN